MRSSYFTLGSQLCVSLTFGCQTISGLDKLEVGALDASVDSSIQPEADSGGGAEDWSALDSSTLDSSTPSDAGTDGRTTSGGRCGDGIIQSGETCEGDTCPTSCVSVDACNPMVLSGSLRECTAECTVGAAITTCVHDDGCCAAGCSSDADNDCPSNCNNGQLEDDETCDNTSDTPCPDTCAPKTCSVVSLAGTAEQCTAECVETPTTQPADDDGCCPSGADNSNDNDCTEGRSCTGLDVTCSGESCCKALAVPGGTFMMGRSVDGGADEYDGGDIELPEHSVTVSAFVLDKFEITVGRFRAFLASGATNTDLAPEPWAGANPNIEFSGWNPVWVDNLNSPEVEATSTGTLLCDPAASWTIEPGDNEGLPLGCMNWNMAFSFCVWDGGRLPTEAEWEYAAAGGALNNLYPWGSTDPMGNPTLANFRSAGIAPAGSYSDGDAEFGHSDMAGSLFEYVLDLLGDHSAEPQKDPAFVPTAAPGKRVVKGGGWSVPDAFSLRPAYRGDWASRTSRQGARCARNP